MLAICGLSFLAALILAPTDGAKTASLDGDYAGWAYLNDGMDFPLRLHVRTEGDAPIVTLDYPSERKYGIAVERVALQGASLRFSRKNSEGQLWEFVAEGKDNELSGRAEHGGKSILEFQVHRSVLPLPTIEPPKYPSCRGIYRSDEGRVLVISPWFWGELRYTDLRTGRHGTLFALTETSFFAGDAMYVPTTVFARIDFQRNDKGDVESAECRFEGEPPARFRRLRFVEELVSFRNGNTTLHGTLIKPDSAGPHPAVVVLGGSGWRTRKDVRGDADLFVANGVAALTYDQRGNGDSSGNALCSFEETASDARAGVHFLRGRGDIIGSKVGLSGRSRGGWIAPLAASKLDTVGFLVLFVPPAISPAAQETTRRLSECKKAGFSEEEMAEARRYLELQWASSRSEEDWNRYVGPREVIEKKGWLDILDGPASRESEDYRWMQMNMAYDPIPALERIKCPLLALLGERDDNVVPSENIPAMSAALEKAGNKQFRIVVVPGADHGLRHVDANGLELPLHRTKGFAPGVWDTIREWLRKDAKILNP